MESANDRASEKPLGVMIKQFEDEDPIPDKWRDSNPLIKLVTVYFVGHIFKMLGIKNKYAKLYEEEMARFRVEVPELADADDEDVFDYVLGLSEKEQQEEDGEQDAE